MLLIDGKVYKFLLVKSSSQFFIIYSAWQIYSVFFNSNITRIERSNIASFCSEHSKSLRAGVGVNRRAKVNRLDKEQFTQEDRNKLQNVRILFTI